MQELDFINTWLGGHHITIEGIRLLAKEQKTISVCEIGCGGGDNLRAIDRWAKKNQVQVQITGIDIKESCIEYAKQHCADIRDAQWICSDYQYAILPVRPDIIFSSLFCHHFDDQSVVKIFMWMQKNARLGFFINDLHRHRLAYHSIKILSSLFSASYMVKNDAPLSVLRGFSRSELKHMMNDVKKKNAGMDYALKWRWAFRWLLIAYKHDT